MCRDRTTTAKFQQAKKPPSARFPFVTSVGELRAHTFAVREQHMHVYKKVGKVCTRAARQQRTPRAAFDLAAGTFVVRVVSSKASS